MIAIVHSIYSQSVHALALNAGSMDNDAWRYCSSTLTSHNKYFILVVKQAHTAQPHHRCHVTHGESPA